MRPAGARLGQVVVDAWENGGVRCFVQRPQEETAYFGFLIGDGTLQVSRNNAARGKAYRSTVELKGEGTEAFMMHYLLESEQILSLLKVEATVEDGVLRSAVGYLVQLLPEGVLPRTADVIGANTALLSLAIDRDANRVVVTAAVDNLAKRLRQADPALRMQQAAQRLDELEQRKAKA